MDRQTGILSLSGSPAWPERSSWDLFRDNSFLSVLPHYLTSGDVQLHQMLSKGGFDFRWTGFDKVEQPPVMRTCMRAGGDGGGGTLTVGKAPMTLQANCKTSEKYWGKTAGEETLVFRKGELLTGTMDKAQYGKYGLVHGVQVRPGPYISCFLHLSGAVWGDPGNGHVHCHAHGQHACTRFGCKGGAPVTRSGLLCRSCTATWRPAPC